MRGPLGLCGGDSTPCLCLCARMPGDTAVGVPRAGLPSLLSMENSLVCGRKPSSPQKNFQRRENGNYWGLSFWEISCAPGTWPSEGRARARVCAGQEVCVVSGGVLGRASDARPAPRPNRRRQAWTVGGGGNRAGMLLVAGTEAGWGQLSESPGCLGHPLCLRQEFRPSCHFCHSQQPGIF